MRFPQQFAVVAMILLPPITALAQTTNAAVAPTIPPGLTPAAAEVAKLAKSGVGDTVILAFIAQSHAYYNLSADNLTALKTAGVSSPVMTAMLNHDRALQTPSASSSANTSAPASAASPSPPADSGSEAVASDATPAPSEAVVAPPPPAPQVEAIPVSPGPDYVWTPGYWSWNGGVWIWMGGYWHYPVRPGQVWVGGHWNGRGHARVWVGGHWR